MMVVERCGRCGSTGQCDWWCVSYDRMIIAKFRCAVDANIYVLCCLDSGHTKHAKLASGLVV